MAANSPPRRSPRISGITAETNNPTPQNRSSQKSTPDTSPPKSGSKGTNSSGKKKRKSQDVVGKNEGSPEKRPKTAAAAAAVDDVDEEEDGEQGNDGQVVDSPVRPKKVIPKLKLKAPAAAPVEEEEEEEAQDDVADGEEQNIGNAKAVTRPLRPIKLRFEGKVVKEGTIPEWTPPPAPETPAPETPAPETPTPGTPTPETDAKSPVEVDENHEPNSDGASKVNSNKTAAEAASDPQQPTRRITRTMGVRKEQVKSLSRSPTPAAAGFPLGPDGEPDPAGNLELVRKHVQRFMEKLFQELDIARLNDHEGPEQTLVVKDKKLRDANVLQFLRLVNTADENMDNIQSEAQKRTARRAIRFGARSQVSARVWDWLLLSICAHSALFRHAIENADDWKWRAIDEQITGEEACIETFAKLRGIEWEERLATAGIDEDQVVPNIESSTPDRHEHLVTRMSNDTLQVSMYDDYKERINIKDCVIPQTVWGDANPHKRDNSNEHECIVCGATKKMEEKEDAAPKRGRRRGTTKATKTGTKTGRQEETNARPKNGTKTEGPSCKCTMDDLRKSPKHFSGERIELFEDGEMGTGVRALQFFGKDKYFAEYVGEVHKEKPAGSEYVCGRKDHSSFTDADYQGNWVRFINHSCEANTAFREEIVGENKLTIIQAERDIDVFERLTVDYGSDFFTGKKINCRCNSDNCKLWNCAKSDELLTRAEAKKAAEKKEKKKRSARGNNSKVGKGRKASPTEGTKGRRGAKGNAGKKA